MGLIRRMRRKVERDHFPIDQCFGQIGPGVGRMVECRSLETSHYFDPGPGKGIAVLGTHRRWIHESNHRCMMPVWFRRLQKEQPNCGLFSVEVCQKCSPTWPNGIVDRLRRRFDILACAPGIDHRVVDVLTDMAESREKTSCRRTRKMQGDAHFIRAKELAELKFAAVE